VTSSPRKKDFGGTWSRVVAGRAPQRTQISLFGGCIEVVCDA
jgi:hypothetical protein